MNQETRTGDAGRQLSIVVPAYNEAGGIGRTLEGLREAFPQAEIIVVDDGSSDGTAEAVAAVPGIVLVRHPYNRGYGASIRDGMLRATRPLVAWFDADSEHRSEDLARMVERLEREGLAAVLGQRPNSVSLLRGFGKLVIRLLGRVLRVRAGSDLNCGLRLFRREVILPYLHLLPEGYSASLTSTVILVERGYPFAFEPIRVNPRIGTSKVALSDGFEALILLLRVITLFAPMRIFLGASLLLSGAGLAYGLAMALIAGRGFPVAAALLFNTGVVLGALGLIADQISQMRLSTLRRAAGDEPRPRGDAGDDPR